MASAIRARSSDVDLTLGSHTGPRHVKRRIRGRTHGSTRPRSVLVRKDSSCINGGVHTWPCGMPTRSRSPFAARPRRRAMLVAAPVSSMKTSLLGLSSSWASNQSSRRFRMSGRFCSAAYADFFERQAAAVEKGPQRRPARLDTSFRDKLLKHLADGRVRRRLNETENVISMRVKLGVARLPLTARCAIPGLARLSDPSDRRRQPNPKPIGRTPGRRPRKRRIDNRSNRGLGTRMTDSLEQWVAGHRSRLIRVGYDERRVDRFSS